MGVRLRRTLLSPEPAVLVMGVTGISDRESRSGEILGAIGFRESADLSPRPSMFLAIRANSIGSSRRGSGNWSEWSSIAHGPGKDSSHLRWCVLKRSATSSPSKRWLDAVIEILTPSAFQLCRWGGATNIGGFLDLLGPHGIGSNLTRERMEQLGFYVCVADLEDELIRSLGATAVERVVRAQGELELFRTFQKQPAWQGLTKQEELSRFFGTHKGRKNPIGGPARRGP